jgi:Carboxypeptidase regulatory-like domain
MFLLLAIALLQAPQPSGGIRGVVLNTENAPLSGARLELAGPDGVLVMRSDSEGQFAFPNLSRGGYRLSVKKEGYVREEYGQRKPGGTGTPIALEDGKPLAGIAFHLQRAPTISGEVRNEDGFPIANILVQAMRRSYGLRGNRTITLFSNTLTDDKGAYRLYWLDPGDYYVNASYLPQLPTPVNANENIPRATYAPTYFPGTSNPVEAELVRLEGGNGRDINFRLQRAPAVTVRGTVYSVIAGGTAPAKVTLRSPEESGSTSRYDAETDAKGAFEMSGITAGTYVLSAKPLSGTGEVGYAKIEVLNIDRPRSDVLVGPGMTISVRLFGEVPPSVSLRTLAVSLWPLETYLPGPAVSLTQPDGMVIVPKVQPGDYLLSVAGLPESGYVRGARSGTRDVLEQFVSVQYDSSAPLDIQLAFDGGQITGTVTNSAGEALEGATLTLVPDVTRRHRPDQYRAAISGADGSFSMGGIPPGEYKVFAWESIETNAWLNADFMRPYEELGTPAAIGANAKIPAQLRAIPPAR